MSSNQLAKLTNNETRKSIQKQRNDWNKTQNVPKHKMVDPK